LIGKLERDGRTLTLPTQNNPPLADFLIPRSRFAFALWASSNGAPAVMSAKPMFSHLFLFPNREVFDF